METLTIRKKNLKRAWMNFVTHGNIDSTVRPVIAESWEKCKNSNLDPLIFRIQRMDPDTIEKELQAQRHLIDISVSIMKNISDFVQGTGFIISLANNKGMILEIVGEENIVKKAGIHVGDIWSEESVGTNSIGLCVIYHKPFQLFASEHFLKSSHEWTCSSAPIFDDNQNLLGVLTMTGECNKAHLHTLGMVVAGVNAIENSLRMQKSIVTSNAYKNAIMESVDEAVVVLNADKTVKHINDTARRLLKIDSPLNDKVARTLTEMNGSEYPLSKIIDKCFNMADCKRFFIDEGRLSVTYQKIYSMDMSNEVIGLVLVLRERKMKKQLDNRMAGAKASYTFNELIGKSESFIEAITLAKSAANSVSNVLLLGESGTGKELFAQAIHNAGPRRSGPFWGINCAALPSGLIESELFGYADGAFTGARKGGNPGKFELANGGTLFLDEIGEMPLETQSTLLRVLQDNSIIRIGGKKVISVDMRIIAATNKDLVQEIKMGNFRRDLYYRLNVLTINIPPLRERRDDISVLAEYFLNLLNYKLNKNVKFISQEVFDLLNSYNWPGNVRELQNVLERVINITQESTIPPSSLPKSICSKEDDKLNNLREVPLKEYEKQLITSLLEKHKGNRSKVAKIIGISRTTLYRKINDYNINA